MRVNRKQNINARIIINRVIPGNRRGIKEEKNRDRTADVPLQGVRFFCMTKTREKKRPRMIADANLQVWLENSSVEQIEIMAEIMERRARQARLFLVIVLKRSDRRSGSVDLPFESLTFAEMSRN